MMTEQEIVVQLPRYVASLLHDTASYLHEVGYRLDLCSHIERKAFGDADDGSGRCVVAHIGMARVVVVGAMTHATVTAVRDDLRASIAGMIESDRTFGQKVAQ